MRLAQLYCCVGGPFSRIGAGGAGNTLRPAFVCRSHIINLHILKCKVYQDIFRASVYIGRGPFFDVYFSKPQKKGVKIFLYFLLLSFSSSVTNIFRPLFVVQHTQKCMKYTRFSQFSFSSIVYLWNAYFRNNFNLIRVEKSWICWICKQNVILWNCPLE